MFLLFVGIVFPEYMVVNGIYRKDVGVCYTVLIPCSGLRIAIPKDKQRSQPMSR